jgi:transcription elongation factor GreA
MPDRIPMTPHGHEKLKSELHRLKTEDRPRTIREIEAARAHGDLSENAEYDAAKEKQSHLEGRIAQMEDRLARAQVIDPTGQTPDVVRFGATVVIRDVESAEEKTYTLVGEDEADASNGLISISSPVARALVGKSVDADVQVRVPKGLREFEILEIRYD